MKSKDLKKAEYSFSKLEEIHLALAIEWAQALSDLSQKRKAGADILEVAEAQSLCNSLKPVIDLVEELMEPADLVLVLLRKLDAEKLLK